MDRPLGRAIGNGLETAEAIDCLRGEGPADLTTLVLEEAAEMLVVGLPGESPESGLEKAEAALGSGRALERMAAMIEAQGGDASVVDEPSRLKTARHQTVLEARTSGVVTSISPKDLGRGVVTLGGGRRRMDEAIDLGVGFELAVQPGDEVQAGQRLGTVHAASEEDLPRGAAILEAAVHIGHGPLELRPLVSHRVTSSGVFPTP